jgi:hypothetical protein
MPLATLPSESIALPSASSSATSPATTAGDYRIEALRFGTRWTDTNLSFSFFDGGSYYGSETVGSVSEAVKANVRFILNEIFAPVVNLTFTEVMDTPTSYGLIRFMSSNGPYYAYTYGPPNGWDANLGTSFDVVGDVHLNPAYDVVGTTVSARNNSFRSGPGSHGFASLIHEIGHALGLKHSFKEQNDSPETPSLPAHQNNADNTVMSYTFAGNPAATLMPYDILALQHLYGANPTARSGDTTYVFTQVDQFSPGSGMTGSPSIFTEGGKRLKHTLWDGSGVDTVSFASLPHHAGGYRFDIQPGGWITTHAAYDSVKYAAGTVTNFGTRIALASTLIENVIVSTSNDTIYLNEASNRISGYTPGLAGGTDVIHNSNALDTLDLTSFTSTAVARTQVGNDLELNLGRAGKVTVKGYFSVPQEQRITILYQPDEPVAIPPTESGAIAAAPMDLVASAIAPKVPVATATPVADAKRQVRRIRIRLSTPVFGLTVSALRLSVNGRNLPLQGARLAGGGLTYLLILPAQARFNHAGSAINLTLLTAAGAIQAQPTTAR